MKILLFMGLVISVNSIMLKKQCPTEEEYRSCSFYKEYTCWSREDRLERVRIAPQRLTHCITGCFCRKGYVREYTGGLCIQAFGCRDQMVKFLLDNLPKYLSQVF